jgi:hypothetical protein
MVITAFVAGNKHGSRRANPEVGNNRFPKSEIQTDYRTRPQWGAGAGGFSSWRFFCQISCGRERDGRLHVHPPSSPGIGARSAVLCPWRRTVRESKGTRRTETADSAVGLPACPRLASSPEHPWRTPHGLCPLHIDHRPSFLVDPGQNLFYCYGCARGGDVIRFAELYHQVKFPQSVALQRTRRQPPNGTWQYHMTGVPVESVSRSADRLTCSCGL